jgi:nucleoside-diphosphate-sugar epimerase
MNALAALVARLFGAKVEETADCVDWAPGENRIQALNCQATREALLWRAQTSLLDGLEKMGKWNDAKGNPVLQQGLLQDEVHAVVSSLVPPESQKGSA